MVTLIMTVIFKQYLLFMLYIIPIFMYFIEVDKISDITKFIFD